MIILLCLSILMGQLHTAPVDEPVKRSPAFFHPITALYQSQNLDGQYVWGYATPEIFGGETKSKDGVVNGKYSYLDTNGKLQSVKYSVDLLKGLQIAASNLPVEDNDVAKARASHLADVEAIKSIIAKASSDAAKILTVESTSAPVLESSTHSIQKKDEHQLEELKTESVIPKVSTDALVVGSKTESPAPAVQETSKSSPPADSGAVDNQVPTQVTDTPEVAEVRAKHLALLQKLGEAARAGKVTIISLDPEPTPANEPAVVAAQVSTDAPVSEPKSESPAPSDQGPSESSPSKDQGTSTSSVTTDKISTVDNQLLPVQVTDTPEVAEVRAKHLALLQKLGEAAQAGRVKIVSLAPDAVPVQDNPEVIKAREEHLAAVAALAVQPETKTEISITPVLNELTDVTKESFIQLVPLDVVPIALINVASPDITVVTDLALEVTTDINWDTTTTSENSENNIPYSYGYVSPLISKSESKSADGTIHGGYSYVDAEGVVQTVYYIADDNGFKVAATNIPVDENYLPKPNESTTQKKSAANDTAAEVVLEPIVTSVVPSISTVPIIPLQIPLTVISTKPLDVTVASLDVATQAPVEIVATTEEISTTIKEIVTTVQSATPNETTKV